MTNKPGRFDALFSSAVPAAMAVCLLAASHAVAQPADPGLDEPRGLRVTTDRAAPGYVLFSPAISGITYLVDIEGRVVNTWQSDYGTGHGLYLRDDGALIRTGRIADHPAHAGGQGGQIQAFTWDGELVWDYRLANDQYLLHHDISLLPNGNILAIAWEYKTAEEARAAGRRPDELTEKGLWPEVVLELAPRGTNDAEIVWEWHSWDHLIQDFDPEAANYGALSEHPELADINTDAEEISDTEIQELLAGGEIALQDAEEFPNAPDLMHFNSISYNPTLDQIIVSSNSFSEFWIIDHGTTTQEAVGSTGGRQGMGGDILYRWGRASNYDRGGDRPRTLFNQHHVRWIEDGLPGAGNITAFLNNFPGPRGNQSVVVELVPPTDEKGRYIVPEEEQFGPRYPVWVYMAPDAKSFHSNFISGAHRLSNGHTFIDSGAQGRFFEVTPEGEIVWEYWNPYSGEPTLPHHELLAKSNAALYMAFRATKIEPDHPALAGRDLSPLDPQPAPIPHPVFEEP